MNNTHTLRIKKDLYEIEVNDKGEKIYFDMKDETLGEKIFKALDDIEAKKKSFETRMNEIISRNNIEMKDIAKLSISTGAGKEIYLLRCEFYREARIILDSILGENACQKIFGDTNYMDMYNDLAVELKPHLEKMGYDIKSKQKKLMRDFQNKKRNSFKKVIK